MFVSENDEKDESEQLKGHRQRYKAWLKIHTLSVTFSLTLPSGARASVSFSDPSLEEIFSSLSLISLTDCRRQRCGAF